MKRCFFDRDTVKNAIYEKWLDGSNFYDRIWNDKQKLLRELNTNLVHGITRGDSPDKMIKNISAWKISSLNEYSVQIRLGSNLGGFFYFRKKEHSC